MIRPALAALLLVSSSSAQQVQQAQQAQQEQQAQQTGAATTEWRPVVLMHGLLAESEAMSHLAQRVAADFPGIHILNVEITTKTTSLLVSMDHQVERFAAAVRNDSALANGFNLIGHSQGGLITRAYVERFNNPPVHNLVSLAGPHDGVYGVPDLNALCPDHLCPWLADLFDQLLDSGATRTVQEAFTFASYWKDPTNYSAYLAGNIFLADINNERPTKNATYKSNMASLNTLALVYSTHDEIVVPRQSPWFEFFAEGSDQRPLVPMALSPSYLGDWIGLRTLDKSGRLVRLSVTCGHQDIPRDICLNQSYVGTVQQLLNNTL